jgi:hypothetical protein
MVEVLFLVVLIAYVLYVSQVLISLTYWSLCLTPQCITFKKPTTMGVRSVIKLDLLSNVARLLWCSSYPLFLLWGSISIDNYITGIAYIIFIFCVLFALRLALKDGKTLDKDYEDVMPDFAKYFKYGLFNYYRFIRGYINVKR